MYLFCHANYNCIRAFVQNTFISQLHVHCNLFTKQNYFVVSTDMEVWILKSETDLIQSLCKKEEKEEYYGSDTEVNEVNYLLIFIVS